VNTSTKELSKGSYPATVCRTLGWTVGMRIRGNEGRGETVIELTAIGQKRILAKVISHNGEPRNDPHEATWTLANREWEATT